MGPRSIFLKATSGRPGLETNPWLLVKLTQAGDPTAVKTVV